MPQGTPEVKLRVRGVAANSTNATAIQGWWLQLVTGDGFQLVRAALRAARKLASQHRRGGLAGLHRQLTEALEALDRIEGGQAEQLQLALWPRDLTCRAHTLRMDAVGLNRQAFALEEQATAWWLAGWGDQPVVAAEGDEC
jgi:hypothetical protein